MCNNALRPPQKGPLHPHKHTHTHTHTHTHGNPFLHEYFLLEEKLR